MGVEVRSPHTYFGTARSGPSPPIDVQNREQNDWQADLSVRAGVQFEKLAVFERKIQLLAEYFNGYSPNGQFYRDKVQYIGLGIHLYLY